MSANGAVKFVLFEQLYRDHPEIVAELATMLEHPPHNGVFSIHWCNGKINHARKEETVQKAS